MLKIETKAKIILTVPDQVGMVGTSEEVKGRIILAVEQHINENAGLLILEGGKIKVGVRVHMQ